MQTIKISLTAKIIILFLVFSFSLTYSQQIKKTAIISSDEYYYGNGISHEVNEATDHALKELTSQIAVRVASSFKRVVTEKDDEFTDHVESILNTHAAATLRNVKTIKNPTDDGMIEVFCYLKKTEVENIFNERRQLIADMVSKANQYTDEQNISHALKLYYFAATLLNSLPDENVVFQGVNYTTEIPEKINSLIQNVSFSFLNDQIISEKERQITLEVKHSGKAAALLDFNFWDGANQVSVQGRDGLATFLLVGASVKFDELKLNLKTAYYECRKEYAIIETLWDLVKRPDFISQKIVRLQKTEKIIEEEIEKKKEFEQAQIALKNCKYNFAINFEKDIPVAEKILIEANKILEILEKGSLDSVKAHYASDKFLNNKISNYIKYNHPQPLDKNIQGALNKTTDGYELRRIRILHTYPTIYKQTTDYLVLDFNEQGQLVDLNTCIYDQLYQRFVKAGEYGMDWGNRQQIIKFLEKYRTAYLTRDIETVDLMFAEEALIIVGRKMQTKKLPENMVRYQPFGRQPSYEYIKLTKKEYLDRQLIVFKSMQDIFLDFSTFNIIRKNDLPSIYGIEMRQSYTSTGYADEGYLFLLIDFDPDTLANYPLIYVRAWQPNAWKQDELIRLANYKVYK